MELKIEKEAILLEKEVFVYNLAFNINQKPRYFHRAKDWDINNPAASCKLTLYAAAGNCCNIKLEDEDGKFFGHSVIDCYPGSQWVSSSLGCVVDSCRYFTLKITNAQGNYELIGLGFSTRTDSSHLTKTLTNYFSSINQIVQAKNKSNPSTAQVQNPAPQVKREVIGNSSCDDDDTIKTSFVGYNPTGLTNSEGQEEPGSENNGTERVDQAAVPVAGYPSYLIAQVYAIRSRKVPNFNYECPLCSSSFSKTQLLKKHIETNHEAVATSILFYCDIDSCNCGFLSKLTLAKHKKSHHGGNDVFKSNDEEKNIDMSESGNQNNLDGSSDEEKVDNKEFEQEICSMALPSDRYIEIPRIYRNTLNQLMCHLCPTILQFGKELEDHWEKVHGLINPIVCKICSLVFSFPDDFDEHTAALHPKGYSCPHCSFFGSNESSIKCHVFEVHKKNFLVSL